MRYINRCFFYKFDRTWCGVVIIPNCKCAFTLHKWPNQESQTVRNTCSSLFIFISLSKIKQSRKGHLETERKRKSEPEIWKLSTPINYRHLWRPCTIVYCGQQIWNILLCFCLLKTLGVGTGMCRRLWFRGTRFKLDARADVGLHPYYFWALHRNAVASRCEESLCVQMTHLSEGIREILFLFRKIRSICIQMWNRQRKQDVELQTPFRKARVNVPLRDLTLDFSLVKGIVHSKILPWNIIYPTRPQFR